MKISKVMSWLKCMNFRNKYANKSHFSKSTREKNQFSRHLRWICLMIYDYYLIIINFEKKIPPCGLNTVECPIYYRHIHVY